MSIDDLRCLFHYDTEELKKFGKTTLTLMGYEVLEKLLSGKGYKEIARYYKGFGKDRIRLIAERNEKEIKNRLRYEELRKDIIGDCGEIMVYIEELKSKAKLTGSDYSIGKKEFNGLCELTDSFFKKYFEVISQKP